MRFKALVCTVMAAPSFAHAQDLCAPYAAYQAAIELVSISAPANTASMLTAHAHKQFSALDVADSSPANRRKVCAALEGIGADVAYAQTLLENTDNAMIDRYAAEHGEVLLGDRIDPLQNTVDAIAEMQAGCARFDPERDSLTAYAIPVMAGLSSSFKQQQSNATISARILRDAYGRHRSEIAVCGEG